MKGLTVTLTTVVGPIVESIMTFVEYLNWSLFVFDLILVAIAVEVVED